MRILLATLALTTLCNFSATGQDGPNNAPAPQIEGFTVCLQIYQGPPEGNDPKLTRRKVCNFVNLIGREKTPKEFDFGAGRPEVSETTFYGHRFKYEFKEIKGNCVEIRIQTIVSKAQVSDDTNKDEIQSIVYSYAHVEKVQLGGTIRIRMSPEDDKNETWAELKIEKAK